MAVSRSATIDKISKIVDEAVDEVIQCLYTLSDDCEKERPVGNKYPVPKLETRGEAEMKLQEEKRLRRLEKIEMIGKD